MRRHRATVTATAAAILTLSACVAESTPLTVPPPSETVRLAASQPASLSVPTLPEVGPPRTDFETVDYENFDDPTTIDNQWLPLTPWTKLIFTGITNEDNELINHRVVSIVTDMTKVIDGIETVVVWDLDYSDGNLAEAELAFFAQDNDGNVWRMGEHPQEYEGGVVIDAPTWLSGIGDARAGIAMPGDPQTTASSYSQGWSLAVEFFDRALIGELDQTVCVPTGCYEGVLLVDEFNDEEPGAFQHKYFAPGLGNIRVDWSGSDETREELELVSIVQLSGADQVATRAAVLQLEAEAYIISPDIYGLTDPINP